MSELAFLGKIYSYEKSTITIDKLKLILKTIPDDISLLKVSDKYDIQQEYRNLTEDIEMNISKSLKKLFIKNLFELQNLIPKIKNSHLKNYFKKEIDLENVRVLIKYHLLAYLKPKFLKNGFVSIDVFEDLIKINDFKQIIKKLASLGFLLPDDINYGDFEKSIWLTRLELLDQLQQTNDPPAKIFAFYKIKLIELMLLKNLNLLTY